MGPHIVVGCPVKDRAWCLPAWFEAIEKQGMTVDPLFIISESEDGTEEILRAHDASVISDREGRPGRNVNAIDGHWWGKIEDYAYMADLRNQLMDAAVQRGADYFLSLDSDIMLPQGGLETLLEASSGHMGIIAPAVPMGNMVGTTTWNRMDWAGPGIAERIVQHPTEGRADVVMAAMLFDATALRTVRFWPHHQGEDVGLSLDCQMKGVPMWWWPSVRCDHLMRKQLLG